MWAKIRFQAVLFCLLVCNIFTSPLIAEDSQVYDKNLGDSFLTTFRSSHEFAACQVFQQLGYDLAEINQIKRVTPYPSNLSVIYEGAEEKEYNLSNASETSDIRRVVTFKKLDIFCEKVHYYGMVIDKVVFGFPNCALETDYLEKGRLRFASAEKIELKVLVSENDLLEVLKLYPKSKALSRVSVNLTPNKCVARGRVKMGIIVADFEFRGYTQQRSPKKVDFVCEKLKINKIPQPRIFVKGIMNYVNPVFDSSRVWINLNVQKMSLIENFVETQASIDKKEKKNAN